MEDALNCDVLVVGGGAAGTVLAARLAETGLQVILLEAGPAKRGWVNRVPALAFMASIDPATNWDFTTEPIPGLDGRRQRWSQGRMLGGSSGINGMLWMRGGRQDYDLWAAAGCPGWGWEDVLPIYRAIEASDRAGDPLHGEGGPLHIRRARLDLPLTGAFLSAMAGADVPVVEDVNGDVPEGFGLFDVNISGGERHGVVRAYLDPARKRPNLRLLTGAGATRLIVAQGRVTGAAYMRDGLPGTVLAREVAVCCGAIKTPQLLMLSGLGPGAALRAMGIDAIADCPGVGANLHNHPAVALRYALSAPLSAYGHLAPLRAAAAGMRYLAGRRGPLGESYVAMGGLFRSRPDRAAADLMAVVMPALVTRAEVGARLTEIFERRHGFAVSVSLARQDSRGRVALASPDPEAAPRIEANYFSAPNDMAAMVDGLLRLRQALRAAPQLSAVAQEIAPQAGAETPDALAAAVRAACGTFYHPGGTCRMGGAEAPVDPRLRFRGIDGLRIADASVVPLPMGATMHAPSILIGERAARFIAEDLRLPPATPRRIQ